MVSPVTSSGRLIWSELSLQSHFFGEFSHFSGLHTDPGSDRRAVFGQNVPSCQPTQIVKMYQQLFLLKIRTKIYIQKI